MSSSSSTPAEGDADAAAAAAQPPQPSQLPTQPHPVTTTTLVDLLGPSLMVNPQTQKSTVDLLKNKTLILLYFSAHWCPPCQAFTPKLRDFYKKAQQQPGIDMEIIYVSSDRSLTEFNDYYGKMPWLAIPTDAASAHVKNQLAQKLNIRGIPALVVLQQQQQQQQKEEAGKEPKEKEPKDNDTATTTAVGEVLFVTDQGRNQVMTALSSSTSSIQSLLEEWKTQPAVPFEQALQASGSGSGNGTLPDMLWQALITILKNPIYLFGLLYLYKFYMRSSGKNNHPPMPDASSSASSSSSPSLEDSEF